MDVTVEEFQDLETIAPKLDDPRTPINILHPVENIIAISIAAIIAGAEGPKSMARWADEQKDWLATWLLLPLGKTPSLDCIRTFFSRVDPVAFQSCFFHWLNGFLPEDVRSDDPQVMAIDGKTLRHSFDTAKARRPLHIVCAWVAEHHISLGQVATEEKSNEITAIPELLDQIDISGTTITIDAMGCQKEIAARITHGGGNFVIGVKGNQPTLPGTIESFFDDHWKDGDWFKGRCHRFQTIEQQDECQVERYYYVAQVPKRKAVFQIWPSVQAIGMVTSVHRRGEQVTGRDLGKDRASVGFLLLAVGGYQVFGDVLAPTISPSGDDQEAVDAFGRFLTLLIRGLWRSEICPSGLERSDPDPDRVQVEHRRVTRPGALIGIGIRPGEREAPRVGRKIDVDVALRERPVRVVDEDTSHVG